MKPLTVVLAGGLGKRMGGNKPMVPFAGATLIEATLARLEHQTDRLLVNAGAPGTPVAKTLSTLRKPLIHDEPPFANLGPLCGVRTALAHTLASGDREVVTVPCDMPFLPLDLIKQLTTARSKAPVVFFAGKSVYPLCALWRTEILAELTHALSNSQASRGLGVMAFLSSVCCECLPVKDDHAFRNINSMDDLRV